MMTSPFVARFRIGRIVATPAALAEVQQDDILAALRRHHAGDWGDLVESDREANDRALLDGTRLLSAYQSRSGVRFWIITEADRSTTTILLPQDY
jgi:hypothetical protein